MGAGCGRAEHPQDGDPPILHERPLWMPPEKCQHSTLKQSTLSNHHALRHSARANICCEPKLRCWETSHNCKTQATGSTIVAIDAAMPGRTCLPGNQQVAARQCQELPMAPGSMSSEWKASWAGAARSQRWRPYLAPTHAAAGPDHGRTLARSAAAPESTSAKHRTVL